MQQFTKYITNAYLTVLQRVISIKDIHNIPFRMLLLEPFNPYFTTYGIGNNQKSSNKTLDINWIDSLSIAKNKENLQKQKCLK